MNNCKDCSLRLKGHRFAPTLLRKVPLHLRQVFICNNEDFHTDKPGNEPSGKRLCPADLWVLTFIATNDPFATRHVVITFDRLVTNGMAELLLSLFESASYEIRRNLWLRMTSKFPQRLHLFDSLFEKECLAPVSEAELQKSRHLYQFSFLHANSGAPALFDELY